MKTVFALTLPRYKTFSAPRILAGFRRDFLDSWTNKDLDGDLVSPGKGHSKPAESDSLAG